MSKLVSKIVLVFIVVALASGGIGFVFLYGLLTLFVWLFDNNPDHVVRMSLIGATIFSVSGVCITVMHLRNK